MPSPLYIALIRTHHITSRRKVSALRKAASQHDCHVLLRSGGCPGIMYCEGSEEGVNEWVATVNRLRYKDYRLVARPQAMSEATENGNEPKNTVGLSEVPTVTEFGSAMKKSGLWTWWRKGMGYVS